ncbi:MAG: hypothetical protein IJI24_09160, partial [Lachnospiraceae bacterium]|nr:hypothetical protein [Lachnospiraceae bacterium]
MVKAFLDVFPDLELDGESGEILEHARVTKISMNLRRDRMQIYVEADRLIEKAVIYRVEDAIERQIFEGKGVDVRIIERFCLSGQYTARNLMPLYQESMLLELKQNSMALYDMMRRAKQEFTDEDTLILTVEDNCVSMEKEKELTTYLEKVFCERCGQNLKLTLQMQKSKENERRELSERRVQLEVEAIRSRLLAAASGQEQDEDGYMEVPQSRGKSGKQDGKPGGKQPSDRQGNPPEGDFEEKTAGNHDEIAGRPEKDAGNRGTAVGRPKKAAGKRSTAAGDAGSAAAGGMRGKAA